MWIGRLIFVILATLFLAGLSSCQLIKTNEEPLELKQFKARYKLASVNSNTENTLKNYSPFLTLKGVSEDNIELVSQFSGTGYSPILDDRQDLIGHLIDLNQGSIRSLFGLFEPFKKIDDFPSAPRYSGIQYDHIKSAFSKCSLAAREANNTLMEQLGLSATIEFTANDFTDTLKKYDENCLYTIDRVPDTILKVSGILLYHNRGHFDGTRRTLVPFCSATAVEKDKIATARHCFMQLDGTEYQPYSMRKMLEDGLVYFSPLSKDQEGSYIKLKPTDKLDNKAFKANEDIIYLETDRDLTNFTNSRKLEPGRYSEAIYIVGNTDLIAEFEPQNIHDRVRASIPDTCALLEVTEQGCIYHTCQTGRSTSGAGLIAIDENNKVSLLGIHNGPIGASQSCETEAGYNAIKNDNLNQGVLPL